MILGQHLPCAGDFEGLTGQCHGDESGGRGRGRVVPFVERAALDYVVLFRVSLCRVYMFLNSWGVSWLVFRGGLGVRDTEKGWEREREGAYPRMQCQHRPVIELHFHNSDHADAVVDGHGAVHLAFAAGREVDDQEVGAWDRGHDGRVWYWGLVGLGRSKERKVHGEGAVYL